MDLSGIGCWWTPANNALPSQRAGHYGLSPPVNGTPRIGRTRSSHASEPVSRQSHEPAQSLRPGSADGCRHRRRDGSRYVSTDARHRGRHTLHRGRSRRRSRSCRRGRSRSRGCSRRRTGGLGRASCGTGRALGRGRGRLGGRGLGRIFVGVPASTTDEQRRAQPERRESGESSSILEHRARGEHVDTSFCDSREPCRSAVVDGATVSDMLTRRQRRRSLVRRGVLAAHTERGRVTWNGPRFIPGTPLDLLTDAEIAWTSLGSQ